MSFIPSLEMCHDAYICLGKKFIPTMLLSNEYLNKTFGAKLFFKCENMQPCGSFKIRGAWYCIHQHKQKNDNITSFVTHSSGNHGYAVAYVAKRQSFKCHIVVPSNITAIKKNNIKNQDAILHLCEPTLESRKQLAHAIQIQNQAMLIHPYDDPYIVAGQSTVVQEIIHDINAIDILLCPIGGGGLIGGSSLFLKAIGAKTKIIGVRPLYSKFPIKKYSKKQTISPSSKITMADGLRSIPEGITLSILNQYVDDVVFISEESIVESMNYIHKHLKLVVEPSAAVAFATLLENKITIKKGDRIGIILSGGNVDMNV